jgi:hypothetical protein
VISSRKPATLLAGAVMRVILTTWHHPAPYGLTIGPIAKIGLDTQLSGNAVAATPEQVLY